MTEDIARKLRGKILGAFVRDARLKAGKTTGEAANLIGLSAAEYEGYELGEQAISLPEVEMLAPFLHISINRLLEGNQGGIVDEEKPKTDLAAKIKLRQRIIGAKLRQRRIENQLTVDELALQIGIAAPDLEAYEYGTKPIPIPELENICSGLNWKVRDLLTHEVIDTVQSTPRRACDEFGELAPEIQSFVLQPNNRPYLELAIKLSEISADRLRAIAEGLLEITY